MDGFMDANDAVGNEDSSARMGFISADSVSGKKLKNQDLRNIHKGVENGNVKRSIGKCTFHDEEC